MEKSSREGERGWRSWAEARVAAVDRDGWRCSVDALCTTRQIIM
jgi:hypothetical protein